MGTKTICPNCGAITSNTRNCEYCGSFLVQKACQGEDLSKYVSSANSNDVVGLTKIIKKYADILKKNPFCDLQIEIDGIGFNISGYSTHGGLDVSNDYYDGFSIEISFPEDEPDRALLGRFKNSIAYKAFQKITMGTTMDGQPIPCPFPLYNAEFGFDYEGAAKLTYLLLTDVYNVDPKTCVYTIGIFLSSNNETYDVCHYAEYNANGEFIEGIGDGENEFLSCDNTIQDVQNWWSNWHSQQVVQQQYQEQPTQHNDNTLPQWVYVLLFVLIFSIWIIIELLK